MATWCLPWNKTSLLTLVLQREHVEVERVKAPNNLITF